MRLTWLCLPAVAFALACCACMPPSWGAGALLHPSRRPVGTPPALRHQDVAFDSDGVVLHGWLFPAAANSRAVTVVYLHGSGDNRASGVWIAEQLVKRGFDVLAYDSRAHGDSSGDACTYGFFERRDLRRALDTLGIHRAILVGVSLGAAVALQAAAEDPRILSVIAVATFSDLASIGRDRAPFIASGAQIREAFALAEREAHFRVADVSPVKAAARIHVPVLLVHGADDQETRPVHSDRVYAALAGPRQLMLVKGAGHDDALGKAWPEVEEWIDATRARPDERAGGGRSSPHLTPELVQGWRAVERDGTLGSVSVVRSQVTISGGGEHDSSRCVCDSAARAVVSAERPDRVR
jgi:pimeloyl-ACP methyl ester carboxylesterase